MRIHWSATIRGRTAEELRQTVQDEWDRFTESAPYSSDKKASGKPYRSYCEVDITRTLVVADGTIINYEATASGWVEV